MRLFNFGQLDFLHGDFRPLLVISIPGVNHLASGIDNVGHRHGSHPTERFVLHHRRVGLLCGVEDIAEIDAIVFEQFLCFVSIIRCIHSEDYEALILVLCMKLLEMTYLLATRRSPNSPLKQPDKVASEI